MTESGATHDRYARAEALLQAHFVSPEAGEARSIESLFEDHPELARELRELHALCGDIDREMDAEKRSLRASEACVQDLLTPLGAGAGDDRRYRVEGEVGKGGMGVVFRVTDTRLERPLAMKVLLGQATPIPSGRTPAVPARQVQRFLNEARITSQLDHPGIVPVHEVGVDEQGRAFFTMKFVKGRTLGEVLRLHAQAAKEWPTQRVLGILLRVCEAVAFAHERAVIHRDLKPANVMVGDFGEVYVMDWGLARRLRTSETEEEPRNFAQEADAALDPRRSLTQDGHVIGTPAYMPPEQASGHISEMGPHSDVYSIGAVLYELLAGHAPYCPPQKSSTGHQVLLRVLTGPPEPLAAHRAPPELAAICERAMAREPARRYRDVGELAHDMQAFVDGRVVSVYETGAWAETKKWVRRNKALAASVAGAIVLLVVGLTASLVFKARADENATLATKRADDLSTANQTIEKRSGELAVARDDAIRKANDVLSLSAIQELKELEAAAEQLWPAYPDMLPAYEAWMETARVLIEGRARDEGPGTPLHASLADHEAKLAEIRTRAKPLTTDQIEADHKASPSFAEWEKEHAKLVWMRRMLGDETWPSEALVDAELEKESLPVDGKSLNLLAWRLMRPDPETAVNGQEARGLLLARRAMVAARPTEQSDFHTTLAWALFRMGRFDEARSEEAQAVQQVDAQRRQQLEGFVEKLEKAIGGWGPPSARAERSAEARALAVRVSELERDVKERRTFEFDDAQDRWWHVQLSQLVSDLEAFRDVKSGGLFSTGMSEVHSWGIPKRAEFARTIRDRSVEGPEAKRRWEEAIEAIAKSEKYGGVRWPSGDRLTPQFGLLPLGEDPHSHLWEFAHLQSGEEPRLATTGDGQPDKGRRLALTADSCIVLVLVPGGKHSMGAQSSDPSLPNYDPSAARHEALHDVELSPYFISKFEMTQGQWERLAGDNPSGYGKARYTKQFNRDGQPWTSLHPVERVRWTQSKLVLARAGLALPSDAQWEHAARGGTTSIYWTGDTVASLAGAANLSDAFAKAHGGDSWSVWEKDLDDGNALHAEVGTYRANGFGLHEVLGNVWEWCLDGYDSDFYLHSPRLDPVANYEGSGYRVARGAGFTSDAAHARSAFRDTLYPDFQGAHVGVRPARTVTP